MISLSRGEPELEPEAPGGVERALELYGRCQQRVVELEQREREARERALFYERVLGGMVDLIVVKDRDLRVLYANRAFCDYYGTTRGELTGGLAPDTCAPEIAARHTKEDEHVVATGNILSSLPETIVRHDGIPLTFATIKSPLRDDGGSVDMFVSVSRNIVQAALHAGEAIQRSESHHKALLSVIPDLVFRISREGVYLDFSTPSGSGTALPPALFLGKRMHDFLPELAPLLMSGLEAALDTGVLQTIEYQLLYGGDIAYYEARLFPSGPDEVIMVARDVTTQKRAEAEQQRLREELFRAQERVLLELTTPVIPISDRVLVIPIVGDVDAERAHQLTNKLLIGIARSHARVAILDVTGMPVVKPDVAAALLRCANAARMLGATMLITGVRPEVALMLVDIGADLTGIVTLSTLQAGIAYALKLPVELG